MPPIGTGGPNDEGNLGNMVADILTTGIALAPEVVDQIFGKLIATEFSTEEQRISRSLRSVIVEGKQVGPRVSSIRKHLAKRIRQGHFKANVTAAEYDLWCKSVIVSPDSRLVATRSDQGNRVAVIGRNPMPDDRMGDERGDWFVVFVDSESAIIVSGHPVASVERVSLSEDAVWLR